MREERRGGGVLTQRKERHREDERGEEGGGGVLTQRKERHREDERGGGCFNSEERET